MFALKPTKAIFLQPQPPSSRLNETLLVSILGVSATTVHYTQVAIAGVEIAISVVQTKQCLDFVLAAPRQNRTQDITTVEVDIPVPCTASRAIDGCGCWLHRCLRLLGVVAVPGNQATGACRFSMPIPETDESSPSCLSFFKRSFRCF